MFSLVSHRAQFLVQHLQSLLCTSLLFDWNSAFSSQSFAEDTQLLQSCLPDQIHTSLDHANMHLWHKLCMTQNKLNDDKICLVIRKSNRTILPDAQPSSLHAGTSNILFMTCAQNLGFMTSNFTTWQAHFSFCLHGNQMQQLYLPVPNCWSNRNSSLCFCSLQIGLL